MNKRYYVLDTNILLTDSQSIHKFGRNDVVIPFRVLEEVDGHKKRQDIVGFNARNTIKTLDRVRKTGNLVNGVRIEKGLGLLYVAKYDTDDAPEGFKIDNPDNEIIATALTLRKKNPARKVIVVSRDILMRVKCDSLGVFAEDYEIEKAIENKEALYTGFTNVEVDDQVIDTFYAGDPVFIEDELAKLHPNQFVMLTSNARENKTALARFKNHKAPLQKVNARKKGLWGISHRNREQLFALDLLLDPSVQIVTLLGNSGVGKTLLAIAAGLTQTVDGRSKNSYKRMVVTKPVEPVGKEIGFLPGSADEKMLPWLMPLQDNLKTLLKDDSVELEQYIRDGIIEIQPIAFIRGRSISDAFVIIDEVQNINLHELKTIVTRVGEGSKIILLGDIEQVDNAFVNEMTNALTHAVEKFKIYDLSGHITLQKGERSELATLASKIL